MNKLGPVGEGAGETSIEREGGRVSYATKLLILAEVASPSTGSQQDRDPPARGAGGHDNYCDLASNSPRGVCLS